MCLVISVSTSYNSAWLFVCPKLGSILISVCFNFKSSFPVYCTFVKTKEAKSFGITLRHWELNLFLTKVNPCSRSFDGN